MTVHWINTTNLQREKAVLCVKEIRVSQTGSYLRRAMLDLHQEFGITHKVVSTTTDNGANYVSAFDQFGPSDTQEHVDPDEVLATPVFMEDLLREDEEEEELPKHHRCVSHTVNLLATADTSKVPGWTTAPKPAFTKPAGKAQGLWNCQNRRTVAANEIKAAVNRRLQTPGATRWNSYYDSTACLLQVLGEPDKMRALNNVMLNQKVSYILILLIY